MRRRSQLLALVAVGIVIFLVVSFGLARIFGANNAEQSAITGLVKAEAAGDQAGMLQRITGCEQSTSCRARVAEDAVSLKHAGAVSIIQLQPSTSFSFGGLTKTARVAWSVGPSLPIVQCIKVHRGGNVLDGLTVQLLEISRRIKSNAACPRSY
jgi:hypothetical protein